MYIVRIVFYFLCGVYPMWAKTLQFACVRGYSNFSIIISKYALGKTVPFTAVRAPGDTKDVLSLKYLLSAQLMEKKLLR